jgi:hypothetical protein
MHLLYHPWCPNNSEDVHATTKSEPTVTAIHRIIRNGRKNHFSMKMALPSSRILLATT